MQDKLKHVHGALCILRILGTKVVQSAPSLLFICSAAVKTVSCCVLGQHIVSRNTNADSDTSKQLDARAKSVCDKGEETAKLKILNLQYAKNLLLL